MTTKIAFFRPRLLGTIAAAGIVLAAFSTVALGDEVRVTLSGDYEVPPVKTMASGSGMIIINPDMSVSGTIVTTGLAGTMAHIHQGALGKNGPVIVPLAKNGEYGWVVPAGSKFTDAQYQAYKSGDLYVNVHTAENKGGEIRGQLKP